MTPRKAGRRKSGTGITITLTARQAKLVLMNMEHLHVVSCDGGYRWETGQIAAKIRNAEAKASRVVPCEIVIGRKK